MHWHNIGSQDVWDEIIWLKAQLGGRYNVRWRRGHAEKRGEIVHIEDRANHLADGLAAVGYESAPDLRHSFKHGRRWQIRLAGLRPFDSISKSALLHIGTRHLTTYHDSHDHTRHLDINSLFYILYGKINKNRF